MSIAALNYVGELMKSSGIPYQFGEWVGEIPDRYYVGEYMETLWTRAQKADRETGC